MPSAPEAVLRELGTEMSRMLHGAVESPDYTEAELRRLPRWMTDMQNMLTKIRACLEGERPCRS